MYTHTYVNTHMYTKGQYKESTFSSYNDFAVLKYK